MGQYALAPGHGREYETIYILRPNVDREVADNVASRVAEAIKGDEGVVTGAELWGRRRLAYHIQRHHRGIYVYVKYLSRGPAVTEIERQLRLMDSVIRYQTIQLRTNVLLKTEEIVEEKMELDFNLPEEPDEPEVTRERELGLDHAIPDRHRGRRDDRPDLRAPKPDAEAKPAEAKADGKAEAKPAEAKADGKAEAKPAEAKTDGKAEAKPAEAKADGKAEAKPAEAKADGKAEAKPAEAKADGKAEAKPAAEATKSEAAEPAKAEAEPKPAEAKTDGDASGDDAGKEK
ncbi:MAG: 30S ribosomal protein S6 [Deltaproteobacteria bacterium]|nr:30S ribosomal protein S6 [Deltaproteobacteria bacterium]